MNRRAFMKFPLGAAALMALQQSGRAESAERATRGIRVGNGQDRFDEELMLMGGRFDLKVSAKDTGGALSIYDTYRHTKGGPALHLHHSQDEWFFVIEGEFIARVGETLVKLGPGDSAFAPRKIPHAFAMTSEGVGRMLVLFQPSGSMEDFFREASRVAREIPKDQDAVLRNLWHTHGMELVGPPLPV